MYRETGLGGADRSQPSTAVTRSNAATTDVPTNNRVETPVGFPLAATAAAAVVGVLKPVSPRAWANAAALSNRSAGSFSNAFATAAATCGGTDFRSSVTGRAASVTIFMMICCAEFPMCGGSPVSISYSTLASEYTSDRAVMSFSAVACSGLM